MDFSALNSWWSPLEQALTHLSLAIELTPAASWLPLVMLLILGIAAAVDAHSARVPDPIIFFGLLVIVAMRGVYKDWELASRYLMAGIGVSLILYAVNQFYYYAFKRDAYGMGDVKWTLLAITTFSIKPALIAWVLAAWLGLSWLGIKKLALWTRRFYAASNSETLPEEQSKTYVHFAPFLFFGLLAGIYITYLR